MLVAFYKETESPLSKVNVFKFNDRIWVNDTGDIECYREIYLNLTEGSLRKLFLLLNFRNILDLKDLTNTYLDEDYSFNKFHSGEYKLIDSDARIFTIDYIDNIHVLKIKTIQAAQIRTCSYIEIIFDKEIQAPINFAVRFTFRINSMAEKLKEDNFIINFLYFDDRSYKNECDALSIVKKEIKAITILDLKNKSGGFDIVVHLPFGAKAINTSEYCHTSYSKLGPKGKEGDNRSQCIWHFREFYNNEVNKEIGVINGEKLSIEYSMVTVSERMAKFKDEILEENEILKTAIDRLQKANKRLQSRIRRGQIMQIISLVVAFAAIIISIILGWK